MAKINKATEAAPAVAEVDAEKATPATAEISIPGITETTQFPGVIRRDNNAVADRDEKRQRPPVIIRAGKLLDQPEGEPMVTETTLKSGTVVRTRHFPGTTTKVPA